MGNFHIRDFIGWNGVGVPQKKGRSVLTTDPNGDFCVDGKRIVIGEAEREALIRAAPAFAAEWLPSLKVGGVQMYACWDSHLESIAAHVHWKLKSLGWKTRETGGKRGPERPMKRVRCENPVAGGLSEGVTAAVDEQRADGQPIKRQVGEAELAEERKARSAAERRAVALERKLVEAEAKLRDAMQRESKLEERATESWGIGKAEVESERARSAEMQWRLMESVNTAFALVGRLREANERLGDEAKLDKKIKDDLNADLVAANERVVCLEERVMELDVRIKHAEAARIIVEDDLAAEKLSRYAADAKLEGLNTEMCAALDSTVSRLQRIE